MDSLYLRFPDALLPFYPFALLPFTLCSGAAAILHGKLPKEDQEKFHFLGQRLFGIHPIVTFCALLFFNGLAFYLYFDAYL